MTVTYIDQVGTSSGFGAPGFGRLLLRWKGSVYRLLWHDFIAYFILYTIISMIYRLGLSEEQRETFGLLVKYFDGFAVAIPLGFVLGFYCSIVAARWWSQFQAIPWPDTLCMNVSTIIKDTKEDDDESRLMRRTIARYANLAINIAFTMVSTPAKKRFVSKDCFVKEGFLTAKEKKDLENYHKKTETCKAAFVKEGTEWVSSPLPDYWIPLVWASSIVNQAREKGKISTDMDARTLLGELTSLRGQCGGLTCYAWINLPLVYTQVVTIAVYSFFLTTLIGRQYVPTDGEIDLYVPFVTMLQFLFYMGWLKTAESLLNPFGDDDDDFDIDELIDRNHEMGYIIVDIMHSGHPEMTPDSHWKEVLPPGHGKTKIQDIDNRGNDNHILLQERVNGNGAV